MDLLDGYCLVAHGRDVLTTESAETIYRLVCRTDFNAPGFALFDLGPQTDSQSLRAMMLTLKDQLSTIHQTRHNSPIIAVWLGRFNQQITTKFHLDGGPDASLLMLGYEPTRVTSQVRLADYSRCAARHQLTPTAFLDQHNPMFPAGERLLADDITDVARANPTHFQILLVNNSCQHLLGSSPGWQGVLHQAIMLTPQPGEPRVVNSMLLTPGDAAADALTDTVRTEYQTTSQFHQRMS
jgi:hypothetical protein